MKAALATNVFRDEMYAFAADMSGYVPIQSKQIQVMQRSVDASHGTELFLYCSFPVSVRFSMSQCHTMSYNVILSHSHNVDVGHVFLSSCGRSLQRWLWR